MQRDDFRTMFVEVVQTSEVALQELYEFLKVNQYFKKKCIASLNNVPYVEKEIKASRRGFASPAKTKRKNFYSKF